MKLVVTGDLWYWRGPSPFHFVTVPDAESDQLQAAAALVTYGWGMIPVTARVGTTDWTTSLFPKDGRYLIPIKDLVRKAEGLTLGDHVKVDLFVAV